MCVHVLACSLVCVFACSLVCEIERLREGGGVGSAADEQQRNHDRKVTASTSPKLRVSFLSSVDLIYIILLSFDWQFISSPKNTSFDALEKQTVRRGHQEK